MLFKEKMYLSNCDSVRELSNEEIRKRVLIGLVFGNGIILSPNILFDTKGITQVLEKKNVIKFLNEEGMGNFIIRGMNIKDISSFSNYFEKLPNNYKISSLNGKEKSQISKIELKELLENIKKIDYIIQKINPVFENATIFENSLNDEIKKRICNKYFDNEEEYIKFLLNSSKLVSRSAWYEFTNEFFKNDLKKN